MSVEIAQPHLFPDFISLTKSALNNEKLQHGLKKLNDLSEPYLSKYSSLINSQIDKTLKSMIIHKEDFKLLEKIHNAREKFIGLGDKVLSETEEQVSSYYNSITETKNEEKHENEVAKIRVKNILMKCNRIAEFWVKKLWTQIKNRQIDYSTALKLIGTIQSNIKFEIDRVSGSEIANSAKLQLIEQLKNAKILFEMSYETISQQIKPGFEALQISLIKNKDNIIVSVENWKEMIKGKSFKELLQEAKEKLNGLKEVTLKVAQEKIEITVSKENWEKNKNQIAEYIQELKKIDLKKIDWKEKGKELVEVNREKTSELYKKAVEKFKSQKENVQDRYNCFVKAFQERKLAAKNKEESENHSQSTDHE